MKRQFKKQQSLRKQPSRFVSRHYFAKTIALGALLAGFAQAANAEDAISCQRSELQNPPRVVYKCAEGLVIEAEAAAALSFQQKDGESRPSDVSVSNGAVLIELTPGSGPFQISTPQAIAAVRGTIYAVDAAPGKTSVLVLRGEVAVSDTDGSHTVDLLPGDGTDVLTGEAPTATKQWGAKRVANLLARFDR